MGTIFIVCGLTQRGIEATTYQAQDGHSAIHLSTDSWIDGWIHG